MLREYRDMNHVTILANPDHIVSAVFNRKVDTPRPYWLATVTLTTGLQFVMMEDDDVETLKKRVRGGEDYEAYSAHIPR